MTHPIGINSIPSELRHCDQWILWKLEPSSKDGKFKKVPHSPMTGRAVDAHNSEH
jgi:primase-polymerase (primpol)-like protein